MVPLEVLWTQFLTHLKIDLFYLVEAIIGRPLNEKAQEYSFRFGLILVLLLMVFVTWNDIVQLKVFEYLIDLVS